MKGQMVGFKIIHTQELCATIFVQYRPSINAVSIELFLKTKIKSETELSKTKDRTVG